MGHLNSLFYESFMTAGSLRKIGHSSATRNRRLEKPTNLTHFDLRGRSFWSSLMNRLEGVRLQKSLATSLLHWTTRQSLCKHSNHPPLTPLTTGEALHATLMISQSLEKFTSRSKSGTKSLNIWLWLYRATSSLLLNDSTTTMNVTPAPPLVPGRWLSFRTDICTLRKS